jgi:hypothetical protein
MRARFSAPAVGRCWTEQCLPRPSRGRGCGWSARPEGGRGLRHLGRLMASPSIRTPPLTSKTRRIIHRVIHRGLCNLCNYGIVIRSDACLVGVAGRSPGCPRRDFLANSCNSTHVRHPLRTLAHQGHECNANLARVVRFGPPWAGFSFAHLMVTGTVASGSVPNRYADLSPFPGMASDLRFRGPS